MGILKTVPILSIQPRDYPTDDKGGTDKQPAQKTAVKAIPAPTAVSILLLIPEVSIVFSKKVQAFLHFFFVLFFCFSHIMRHIRDMEADGAPFPGVRIFCCRGDGKALFFPLPAFIIEPVFHGAVAVSLPDLFKRPEHG